MSVKGIFVVLVIFMLLSFGAFAQSFEMHDVQCYDDTGSFVPHGLAGGINSPQFNEMDLDFDGTMDLVIFDRSARSVIPYLYKNGGYIFAPQYRSAFPLFRNWIRIRDINNDGVGDIFAHSIESPLNGIEVYLGKNTAGKLSFEKIAFTEGFYEVVHYELVGQTPNLDLSPSDLPDMVDVDGDGDIDILTFTGDEPHVRFYRNTCIEDGTTLDYPKFTLDDICWGKFREDSFNEDITLSDASNKCAEGFDTEEDYSTRNGRHAGSTLSVFDEDGDGDYEAIIGDLTNSHLKFLHNGGTPDNAYMTTIDDTYPSYDSPIDFYEFNAAYFIDVDRDGNQDMIAAPNNELIRTKSNVFYYRNTAENGQHDFEFVENDLFIKDMYDFGTLAAPAICDFNQDGKIDILVGTCGENLLGESDDSRLLMLENISEDGMIAFRISSSNYLEYLQYSSSLFRCYTPSFGDIDNDGDDDLIVATQSGKLIFNENIAGAGNDYEFASPVFEYMDIDVGTNAVVQMIDLNKDNLIDLVIGEKNQNEDPTNEEVLGNINYYQNIGTEGNPMFNEDEDVLPNTPVLGQVVTRDNTTISGSASPFFYDTGNNDFILFTGSESGPIKQYNQVAGNIYGAFNLVSDDIGIRDGERSVINVADINEDGLLDFIVGNIRGGISIYGSDLTLDGSVGIEDDEKIHFGIYPNPSSSLVNISSKEYNFTQVKIYNAQGSLVYSMNGNQMNNMAVDVEEWPTGIYLIYALSDEGKQGIEKFAKH